MGQFFHLLGFLPFCSLLCFNGKGLFFFFLCFLYIYISEQKTTLQTLHVNSKKSQFNFIFLSVFAHKLLFGFFGGGCLSAVACFFPVCKVTKIIFSFSMKATLTFKRVHVMC